MGDGTGSEWRQFRFTVGAPDKEAKFRDALEKEITGDANAKRYPTLYVSSRTLVNYDAPYWNDRLSTGHHSETGIRQVI
jgi:hypothetical protein